MGKIAVIKYKLPEYFEVMDNDMIRSIIYDEMGITNTDNIDITIINGESLDDLVDEITFGNKHPETKF